MTRNKTASLYRMVTDDHVCPFGIKALSLLKRKGYAVEDHHLTTREQTDAFKQAHQVETTPQVFIDGERIGGHDALRAHLGLSPESSEGTSYQPVLALFATTALMALATTWSVNGALSTIPVIFWFVAYSMCLLAVLKLRDLTAFSNQFVSYDLIARRWVPYAYLYPFAEAFAGIGMLWGEWTVAVASIALLIGSIGAASVIKAVYIDRRDLKCACVGGDSTVPLGAISLTENLMMVGMGLWMLLA